MARARLDCVLVDRGLAETRERAQALILAGAVAVDGQPARRAAMPIGPDAQIDLQARLPYVSRGGLKLAHALDHFGIAVDGLTLADVGASTGGFTDCLLQRGAARVTCVDVDIRQLDERIRRHPLVMTLEKNARNLVPADLSEIPSLIVMDVSFISVLKILPALRAIFASRAPAPDDPAPLLLSLIKPQFEAAKGRVGRKGIIRDPEVHAEVLTRIAGEAAGLGFSLHGLIRCAVKGQKGNREFFARWAPGRMEPPGADVIRWVREAVRNETD
jgi:23S rRNA (cytidine1920-2'-O)/16S rRNA (cytidine1409-2'-O)-methyltransferase